MSVDIQHLAPPFRVKARYGWSGQTKGDLGFLEGDVMEVTRITGDWFYGRLLRNRKCSGYFPNNFVHILEEQCGQSCLKEKSEMNTAPSSPLSPVKVVIPAIPARSKPKSSISSSSSRGSRNDAANMKTRSSRLYETSHRHSAPNLPDVPHLERIEHEKYKSRTNRSRGPGEFDTFVGDINRMPPLPPIPSNNADKRNIMQEYLPKSYSSSDINEDRHYLQEKQMLGYDRRNPTSKRSSLTDYSCSNDLFSNSKYLDGSLTSSEDSFALMSDFSATSAGSLARHRFAESFSDSLERSQNFSNIDSSLQNSGGGRMGNILRKFIPKNAGNGSTSPSPCQPPTTDYPRLPDIQNLNISSTHDDARDWLTVKAHLNRSRSLTKYEKHPRYIRALEQCRDLVLHPQDAVYNGLNTNEVKYHGQSGLVDIELAALNLEYIDNMTRKRCVKDGSMRLNTWAQTTFSARYSTTVEKLRGIYIFCSEMFELVDDNGCTDFSKPPKDLTRVLYQKHCTPFQLTCLFKELANSLGITCDIVLGFLKTPAADNHVFKYNHCWLRLLVNKEWRFIDAILGNITNPIHEFLNNKKITKAENDFFLAEPLQFIYTHIPQRESEQHIVPSIDRLSALYLPLVFPSFFKNGLTLYKFSTALAFLEDSEIYECSLEIPSEVEVFASVVIPTSNQDKASEYRKMELAFTQVKRHKTDSTRRIAVVKAVLPPGATSGSLYIHSGIRGGQSSVANIHPLSMMIPLQHNGTQMKYEFAIRQPSENVHRVEMYIVEPQNKYLFQNNEYNFEIIQQPFDGVVYDQSSPTRNRKQPMAIKSPSGKIYDLQKNDPHFAYGTSKVTMNVKEPGTWKGLVAADSGCGWCTFAEWLCI